MKVKMLISTCQKSKKVSPGDILTVSNKLGNQWIGAGYAEEIIEAAKKSE